MFKWDNKGDNKWRQLWQAKAYRIASRVDQLAATICRTIIEKKTTNLLKFLIFELDMKSQMVCFIEENNFSMSYWHFFPTENQPKCMSRSTKDFSMAFLLFYCSWMDPKGFFALNIADYLSNPLISLMLILNLIYLS